MLKILKSIGWFLFIVLGISLVLGILLLPVYGDNTVSLNETLVSVKEVSVNGSSNITWNVNALPFRLTAVLASTSTATTNNVRLYKIYRGTSSYTLFSLNPTTSWTSFSWLLEGDGIYFIPKQGDYLRIVGPTGTVIKVLLQLKQ